MENRQKIHPLVLARAWLAIALITSWGFSAFTGFLLWLAPSGPRSGRMPLLLDLSKRQWGDLHFWFSIAALIITLVHLAIDWRALRGCIRYLTSVHRGPGVCP
jgi:hypothetical protein